MQRKMTLTTALILLLASYTSNAKNPEMMQLDESDRELLLNYSNLDNPYGEVVLNNKHVILQRLVVGAGEWEGIHSHPGNQLYVHIKGGEWSGRLGGKLEYTGPPDGDGAVGWMDAIPFSAEHNSGNTGTTPIDLIYVTLKSDEPISPDVEHTPQAYPNISLELLFENDRMLAQRFQIGPGQWTGIHSRPGNQVKILIKGGKLSERRGGVQSSPSPHSGDGVVGWMDSIQLSEGYEFGNTGDTIIDIVIVTLK